ncbi:MAG: VIT domain-containing protein, partial [Rubrivivax sp.]
MGLSASLAALAQPTTPTPATAPALMRAAPSERPIEWTATQVRARVQGALAVTELTLTFRNPNARELEGQLEFPLGPGQDITGLALQSLDGPAMLPAAVVDKTRARQAFERTVSLQADPALLEQTAGRNFRLRVFPLQPGRPRQVRLEITEALRPDRDGFLSFAPPTGPSGPASPRPDLQVEVLGLPGAGVQRLAGEPARWRWRPPASAQVSLDLFEGERYFVAEVPWRVAEATRPAPERVVLLWDASGSAAGRNRALEMQALEAYLRSLPRVTVTLIVARDRAEPPRDFVIRGGDWHALRQAIEAEPQDGASDAAAWLPPAGLDPRTTVALLVSDGLANWGAGAALPASAIPLHTLSAAPGADVARLRALSAASPGGRHLDLLSLPPREAARALRQSPAPAVQADSLHARALQVDASRMREGVIQVAGVLTAPRARVELQAGGARHALEVSGGPPASHPTGSAGLAARRWASLRVQSLETDRVRHRAEITRLGTRFGIVTAWTSLLVLETLEDHLRFDILPPPGPMREAFVVQRRQTAEATAAVRTRHLDGLAARWREREQWWAREFPKGEPPRKLKTIGQVTLSDEPLDIETDAGPGGPEAIPKSGAPPAPPPAPAAVPSIALQRWQPPSDWARRLRAAEPAQRYALYLDERAARTTSPAFFLDAAEVFFGAGQAELGVRILSNLAEMQLEDRRILRLLAYRLLQAGHATLALPLLERVREIAPEEPQSWRDLGLALEAAGRLQESVEALWETASRPWPARFADVDLIALNELNALAVRHPGLDLSRVDPRLRRNLPVDLRVVLSWDADDTDVDLWVVDPNGELAFFGNTATYQGGLMSRDFTAGYGPEEFVLRQPKPGRYEVRVNFYGHRQQLLA